NLLISLLRHSDRVVSASLAQLVNVIAPIMTEPGGASWKQTTFHPFALTSQHARGEVLDVRLDAPAFDNARLGTSSAAAGARAAADAVARCAAQDGALSRVGVTRGHPAARALDAVLASAGHLQPLEAVTLHHEDPYAANPKDAPDPGTPQANGTLRPEGGR